MITVLENSLTQKKHILNLIDHNGKALGFNPYPGNEKIKYSLTKNDGTPLLSEKDESIEKYLIGAPFHFGNNASFVPSETDDSLIAINIDLVSDNLELINHLTISGDGGEYYIEDIGLSLKDMEQLFSEKKISEWKSGAWSLMYEHGFGPKKDKLWEELTDREQIEILIKRIEKLEEKVNMLGNLK